MKVEVFNLQNKYWVDVKRIKSLLKDLMNYYDCIDKTLTLVLVDNKFIKKLNKKFLGKNYTTDVLSFPLREKLANGSHYLGDIVISVPEAFKQSFKLTHGLERELEILTIHGFLHLLGFDHEKDSGEMEREEEKLKKIFLKERK